MHQRRKQPLFARPGVNALQSPAHRILTDNACHAERLRGDRVTAQRCDMRIAAVPGQRRQHQGAEHVALARRIRAAILERARLDERLEHAGRRHELREKHQLSVGRGLRLSVPVHVHASAQRVDHHRRFVCCFRYLPSLHCAQRPLPFHQSGECARFGLSHATRTLAAFLRISIAVFRFTSTVASMSRNGR